MGYYSNFSITITGGEIKDIIKIIDQIEKISGYSLYAVNDENENCREFKVSEIKWYYWKEDIKNISKKYSEYSFYIVRIGEDIFDLEFAIITNGNITAEKIKPKYPLWAKTEDIKIFEEMFFIED